MARLDPRPHHRPSVRQGAQHRLEGPRQAGRPDAEGRARGPASAATTRPPHPAGRGGCVNSSTWCSICCVGHLTPTAPTASTRGSMLMPVPMASRSPTTRKLHADARRGGRGVARGRSTGRRFAARPPNEAPTWRGPCARRWPSRSTGRRSPRWPPRCRRRSSPPSLSGQLGVGGRLGSTVARDRRPGRARGARWRPGRPLGEVDAPAEVRRVIDTTARGQCMVPQGPSSAQTMLSVSST